MFDSLEKVKSGSRLNGTGRSPIENVGQKKKDKVNLTVGSFVSCFTYFVIDITADCKFSKYSFNSHSISLAVYNVYVHREAWVV